MTLRNGTLANVAMMQGAQYVKAALFYRQHQ